MALPFFSNSNNDLANKDYVDSVATGLEWVSADTDPIDLQEGQLTFDSTTNEVQTVSNGQVVTLSSGNNITLTNTNTYVTTVSANTGDVLTYDGSSLTWNTAPGGYSGYEPVYNKVPIFDNDEIKIENNGDVIIGGKRETNPSKIGLALLRAIESKLDKKIDNISDICDV